MLTRLAPIMFVFLWATGYIGARLGMPFSEPGTFLSIRFATAFLLLSAVALLFKVKWPGWQTALWTVVIGMLIHGAYLGGVFWAIDRGMPAGVAAVIVGLQPLLTALIAGIWLNEKVTSYHIIGLIIGLFGVVLVLLPKLNLSGEGITLATSLVAFLGVCAAATGTVMQKHYGAETNLRTSTALQYLGACIPVFLLSFLTETREIDWSGEMIFSMVWAIFVLSFGAIFLLMWLIQKGSVSQVASLFYLVPAVAAVMGYFLFGEELGPIQLFGMALCAGAVVLASKTPKAEAKAAI